MTVTCMHSHHENGEVIDVSTRIVMT